MSISARRLQRAAGPTSPFTLQYYEDMSDPLDTSTWGVYNGSGSAATQGPRSKDNVVHGVDDDGTAYTRLWVRQLNGLWYASGIQLQNHNQTYGAYEVRMRNGWLNGQTQTLNTRGVGLLWPSGGGWPPELDWYEAGGGIPNRDGMHVTNHFVNSSGGNGQATGSLISYDYTQWHLFRLEWTPNKYQLFIDGTSVYTTTSNVPAIPMWIGFQTAIEGGVDDSGVPKNGTTTSSFLDIDYIKVYSYNA